MKSKPLKVRWVIHVCFVLFSNLTNFVIFVEIVIQVLGIGKCEWIEQRRPHSAEEIYLKSETRVCSTAGGSGKYFEKSFYFELFTISLLLLLLIGKLKAFKRSADGFVKIPPGVYTYNFEVELSDNLPTSCEGKFGFIRYLASVIIMRQMLPVETQTIAFTVIKPHNLNALPVFQVMDHWPLNNNHKNKSNIRI